ncbi:MAG: phage holin family protein [Rhodothermia bacterium]|nr:phage holin family protein [Rhodothermia bacterium]
MSPTGLDQSPKRTTAPDDGIGENGGKIQRLSRQTRSLVDDVKSWVELKMTLTQMEIEEKVDEKVNEAVNGAVIAAMFFMAALFGLTAGALGLGHWLGHPAWGFLIVMALMLIGALILRAAKPKIVAINTPQLPISSGSSDE